MPNCVMSLKFTDSTAATQSPTQPKLRHVADHNYRLIVCFDITAESLYDAYEQLVSSVGATCVTWETSDEWYSDEVEDDEGPGDVDVLNSTITRYYKDHPHKRKKE